MLTLTLLIGLLVYPRLLNVTCPDFIYIGNLIWSVPVHCHVKDSPYNYSCFFINNPYIRVILVFQISIRCCTCHMLAGFPFRLESRFYLFTGIPCIPFIMIFRNGVKSSSSRKLSTFSLTAIRRTFFCRSNSIYCPTFR